MIERILPDSVVTAESTHDVPGTGLFPQEARLVRHAVPARKREFSTGRWCARRALAALGHAPAPIPADPHGAPLWPDGVLGSITHCAGYRAAALARASEVTLLGIDAEPDASLPQGVLEEIALPGERRQIHELRDHEPRVHWDRLLFSAKESVHKSWYPHTGRRLQFTDARITFDADRGTFTARVQSSAGLPLSAGRTVEYLEGHWLAQHGFLLTAIAIVAT